MLKSREDHFCFTETLVTSDLRSVSLHSCKEEMPVVGDIIGSDCILLLCPKINNFNPGVKAVLQPEGEIRAKLHAATQWT